MKKKTNKKQTTKKQSKPATKTSTKKNAATKQSKQTKTKTASNKPSVKTASKPTSKSSSVSKNSVKTAVSTKQTTDTPQTSANNGANKRIRQTGFADTKKYPQKQHPAKFKKTGQDTIEYVTFTSTDKDPKIFNGQIIGHIPLNENINKTKKGSSNEKSYILLAVFEGKRSALGKGTRKYEISQLDKEIVENVFNNAQHIVVPNKQNKPKK